MAQDSIHEDGNTVIAECIEEVAEKVSDVEGCEVCERFKKHYISPARKQHHINTYHCRFSVAHPLKDGKKVFCLPCRKECIERGVSSSTRSHYHCPFCRKIYGRKTTMEVHFSRTCDRTKKSGHFRHPSGRRIGGSMQKFRSYTSAEEKLEVLQQHDKLLEMTEKKLYEWVKQKKAENQPIGITSIRGKARSIFENAKLKLGKQHKKTFLASHSWAKDFLARYNLAVKVTAPVVFRRSDLKNSPEKGANKSIEADRPKDVKMLLIKRVKARPFLYDPLQNAMQDQDTISNSWRSVAEEIGLESGPEAAAMWNELEQKYHERYQSGADLTEDWEYEDHLNFVPQQSFSFNDSVSTDRQLQCISNLTPTMPTQDVDLPSGNKKPIIVTIEENGEDRIGDDAVDNNRSLCLSEMAKIHMEMEFMQKEHEAKMEVLKLKKAMLIKQLNKMK